MQQSGRLFWRNGFVCGCQRQKAELRFSHAGYSYLLMAKGSKHSLRLLFFAAFWSAKSGAKTDPPTKKAKRRGLTLAPGDYSRVCKQTVPSARAFSPHLFERLFCQAGVVRRETRREKSAFSLVAEEEQPTARVPGAGGCIVLFLLHPLNAGRRLFPRKRHADGFGTFAIKSTEKSATSSRVFCTFFPQKGTQKLPGRCLRLLRPG